MHGSIQFLHPGLGPGACGVVESLEIEFGVFQKAAPQPTGTPNRGILHLQRPFSITIKSRRMLI